MDVLTADFETFYDRDFSLSKLTTEEYLRDPRFEVIGVSVKVNAGKPEWFSGPKKQVGSFLRQYDWGNSIGLAHNAMFDMGILSWHFDIQPKKIADTLSMARAIDGPDAGNSLAKLAERWGVGVKGNEVVNALGMRRIDFTGEHLARYGNYCCDDDDLCYALFTKMVELLPPSELNLIDLTIRMFTEPALVLNRDILATHLTTVKAKKAKLMSAIDADKDVLMSNPKLALLLTQMGIVPPRKISLTTGKETWAFGKTDEGFKALLEHHDPRIQAVVAARMGVKSTLEETRTERFIGISERGLLPIPLRYYAAHTGRWGGDDKSNWQNIPRGSPIKNAAEAPEGYTFIDCDSSQIEARTLAWLSGQHDLVDIFERNNAEISAGVPKNEMQFDPYRIMAARIYNVNVCDVTDAQRFVGKWTILGAGYGMGPDKFQAQLLAAGVKLSREMCQLIINVYRETYPMIPRLWRAGDRVLEALLEGHATEFGQGGAVHVDLFGIRLPNSMYLRYPNLREQTDPATQRNEKVYDTKRGRATLSTRIYGGKVTENVCQALARIIVGEQMLQIARKVKVVMTVHDAVGSLAPNAHADKARAYVEACMRKRPTWAPDLPLNCESKMGRSYGG